MRLYTSKQSNWFKQQFARKSEKHEFFNWTTDCIFYFTIHTRKNSFILYLKILLTFWRRPHCLSVKPIEKVGNDEQLACKCSLNMLNLIIQLSNYRHSLENLWESNFLIVDRLHIRLIFFSLSSKYRTNEWIQPKGPVTRKKRDDMVLQWKHWRSIFACSTFLSRIRMWAACENELDADKCGTVAPLVLTPRGVQHTNPFTPRIVRKIKFG